MDKIKPGKNSKIEYYEVGKLFYKKRRTPYLINHWENNPANEPEKYYYALLLLFQPWRDTDELKGDEPSYVEAFHKKQSCLSEAMRYHDKLNKIRDAMKAMEQLVENEVANGKKETQQDDDILPDGCVPIETEVAMKDFQDMVDNVVVSPIDLENSILQFNTDQARIFKKITSTMESGNKILRFCSLAVSVVQVKVSL